MAAKSTLFVSSIFFTMMFGYAQSAFGQDVMAEEIAANAETLQCELHIWPSKGLRSVYHGWFHGGIVDGAIKARDGYKEIPADPLSREIQIAALSNPALPEMLKLPAYKLIVHEEALDSVKIKNTPGRIMENSAPCYAELITDDVFYQEDVINGSYLKTLFRFKSFQGEGLPKRTFGTWAKVKLLSFPPKTQEQNEHAQDEIRTAFTRNIKEFAAFLNVEKKKKSN